MDVNKVVYGDETLIDLSGDTVTPETLLQGATAHNAAGEAIVGTASAGAALQIVATVASGATVTATKGELSVSGESVDGTCTLTVPEAGTWDVVAMLDGQQSVTRSVSATGSYAATLLFASTILNDNDWDTIRAVSDSGEGENYWSIGDCKEVTLDGTVGKLTLSSFTTYAFIIGFNHNASLEGNNRIHFQLGKTAISDGIDVAFCDTNLSSTVTSNGYFSMKSTNRNTGGWKTSNMRVNICGTSLLDYNGTILAVIPGALRVVLKSVTKYTDNVGYHTGTYKVNASATTDYFFLLSVYELSGSTSIGNKNEADKQQQYSYYSAGNSNIKYSHKETSTACLWWLRSPIPSLQTSYCAALDTGGISSDYANYSYGFSPGFCV